MARRRLAAGFFKKEWNMAKTKVLVVDDVGSIRKIWDKILLDDVFEKSFAGNGKEGLQLYKAWRPDVILLDVMMPEMTGYAVLKEIRQGLGDTLTTIVMQTTVSEKEDVMECVKLGIEGYIIKPFEEQEAVKKVLKSFEAKNPEKAKAVHNAIKKTMVSGHLLNPIPSEKGDSQQGSYTPQEYEYLEELKFCLEDGVISDGERRLLMRKQEKLGIPDERAQELEQIASGKKEPHTDAELEYIDEVKFCLEKGAIGEDERRVLDRLRTKLNIPAQRGTELEGEIQQA